MRQNCGKSFALKKNKGHEANISDQKFLSVNFDFVSYNFHCSHVKEKCELCNFLRITDFPLLKTFQKFIL